jgi:DNA-binding CsgD family transcriptional regulator
MTDTFYQAIQCQGNLDKIIPYRNHPLAGLVTSENIEMIKMRREGYTIQSIADTLGASYSKVQRTIRKSPLWLD